MVGTVFLQNVVNKVFWSTRCPGTFISFSSLENTMILWQEANTEQFCDVLKFQKV